MVAQNKAVFLELYCVVFKTRTAGKTKFIMNLRSGIVGLGIATYMLLVGCSSSPSVDAGRRAVEDRIKNQSEGRIKLVDFRKRDGQMAEINGVKVYTMDFTAEIEFTEDCKWITGLFNQELGFATAKLPEKSQGAMSQFLQASTNPGTPVGKGQKADVVGAIRLTRKESGWVVAEMNLSSAKLATSSVMAPSATGTPAPQQGASAAADGRVDSNQQRDNVSMVQAGSEKCVSNLKNIGLGLRIWATDNGDRFPFNVAKASGGTLELCSRGDDGYERNPASHFMVMSNELSIPLILVCPSDSSRTAARNWNLRPENVSYQLRSGKDVDESNPSEVVVRCPIHGHIVLCDGSVQRKSGSPNRPVPKLSQTESRRNACIQNLKAIEGAKEQWAVENKKTDGASTAGSEDAINAFLKAPPVCPNGGTYTYGRIGSDPKCSLGATAGHTL